MGTVTIRSDPGQIVTVPIWADLGRGTTRVSLSHDPCGDRGWGIRWPLRSAGAPARARAGDGGRPPEPSRVPAAALPGGDGGPLARRYCLSDPVDSAAAGQRRGPAGRGGGGRPAGAAAAAAGWSARLRLPDRGDRGRACLLRARR